MQYYITSHFIKLFVFGFAKYEVCYVVYWLVCVCAGRVKRKNLKKSQQGGGGDEDED